MANTKQNLTGYQRHALKALAVERLKARLFNGRKPKTLNKTQKLNAFLKWIRECHSKGKSLSYVAKSLNSFEEDYFNVKAPKTKAKKRVRPKVPR